MPLLAQLPRIGQYDFRLPLVIADLPHHTDALAAKGGLGVPEFRAVVAVHDRGEDGIRIRFPRSNNVGCDCALASYLAEATTPQTVTISPMCCLASSGLRDAAILGETHDPNTADATSGVTVRILPLQEASGTRRSQSCTARLCPPAEDCNGQNNRLSTYRIKNG